ncbi:hypothetical protein [Fastidiosibacter lacustris]|uniref:hypothetical protein n=1 Tax=Fastidiosibacter lacustris TaxID=2056695 RepID=UPI000E3415E8|nr:hypothetical protein [Fastidiosibacter lacustris]
METLILSTGYKLVKNAIGEQYAEIVYNIACTNARNMVNIPLYADKSTGYLKKALPEAVFKKLVQNLGGQRLPIHKENVKISDSKLKEWAARKLSEAGASPHEVAQLLGVKEKTVLNCYTEQPRKPVDKSVQRQLCLF